MPWHTMRLVKVEFAAPIGSGLGKLAAGSDNAFPARLNAPQRPVRCLVRRAIDSEFHFGWHYTDGLGGRFR